MDRCMGPKGGMPPPGAGMRKPMGQDMWGTPPQYGDMGQGKPYPGGDMPPPQRNNGGDMYPPPPHGGSNMPPQPGGGGMERKARGVVAELEEFGLNLLPEDLKCNGGRIHHRQCSGDKCWCVNPVGRPMEPKMRNGKKMNGMDLKDEDCRKHT